MRRTVGILFVLASQVFGQTPEPAPGKVYRFREPHPSAYRIEDLASAKALANAKAPLQSIRAWPANGSTNGVELTSRLVLQHEEGVEVDTLIKGRPLQVARKVGPRLYILQAPDVWTALDQAESLSSDGRITASYPVTRRSKLLNSQYSPRPNDPFFFRPAELRDQWQASLENRDTNGVPLGADLNVRSAWAVSRGEGIVIALADDGVELDHPDLAARTKAALHYNFTSGERDGKPSSIFSNHGTAVAGLAAATADNKIGIAGVAPRANLASWVIFNGNSIVSEEVLMDMFQFRSNLVSVQNHSWGKDGLGQLRVSLLEDMAISNAVQFGRSGRGAVIVRAAGNGRMEGTDVNEDGYLADPRVIAVAAVRLDGRPARYSSPGACVLVAAPSGDVDSDQNPCFSNSPNLVTTDRTAAQGYNRDTESVGGGDYAFGAAGFSGTSGATPQISGLAALILSANPNLTYRDVQQIMILSARHISLADPTLVTNGAGFKVSHNLGFGIPDSGAAVRLARSWSNRPAPVSVTLNATNSGAIPDLGLRLLVQGEGLPDQLTSIVALPGGGPHPDGPMPVLPLVDVGAATEAVTADLRGKAALIRRGGNYFCDKLAKVAEAGAEMAVVYNNTNGDERILMVATDLSMIPSVFISQNDGEALARMVAEAPSVQAQLTLESANFTFNVKDTLQCEFVGVRIDTDHTSRGDVRIVLTSPAGTRSILQRVNQDDLSGPNDWTYYSVQNFFESSYGTWTVSVSDENDKGTGSVRSVQLIVHGVPLTDTDHDGLDDRWELLHFGNLNARPGDDADNDGFSNAREQLAGTNPRAADNPLELDLSLWDTRLARLSWASSTNLVYRVQVGAESTAPLALMTNVPGRLQESEWFVPYTNLLHQFFRVQAAPRQ